MPPSPVHEICWNKGQLPMPHSWLGSQASRARATRACILLSATLALRPSLARPPGGPCSSTPLGGLMPSFTNRSRCVMGSTIASRSSWICSSGWGLEVGSGGDVGLCCWADGHTTGEVRWEALIHRGSMG